MRRALDIPPGLFGDDTSFGAAGRWRDGSNVRFWRGRPQVIGGWESLMADTLTGVCRNLFAWTDNAGVLNLAFGTHSALQVWVGGSLATITPAGLAAGAVDGTGGAGYGTGTWSNGTWSSPATEDYFPRTWSLAAWGETLVASPRGGTIYGWANDTAEPAVALSGAPETVTHMLVAPTDQVFALGCSQEADGIFSPLCIRHSGIRNHEEWTTAADTTAREYILPGGGRIVAGRPIGAGLLVWTSHALFLGTFVGSLTQPWRFDRVGEACGLIGPNAAVVVGQRAFWIGPDLQVYAYMLGGAATPVICPIREAMADNLAASQADKIVASSNSAFSEIRFDYPDARDGFENSRYLTLSVDGDNVGAWARGRMARTAMIDAGPSPSPAGVDPEGYVFWHERGTSADGGAISWHVETADQYLSEDTTMIVRGIWPDIQDQGGPMRVVLTSRFEPQGEERVEVSTGMVPGERKADIRATGRLFKLRFEGASSPACGRIGRPVFDVAPAGRR